MALKPEKLKLNLPASLLELRIFMDEINSLGVPDNAETRMTADLSPDGKGGFTVKSARIEVG